MIRYLIYDTKSLDCDVFKSNQQENIHCIEDGYDKLQILIFFLPIKIFIEDGIFSRKTN